MSGCEWVIEAHGCDAGALRDALRLGALFERVIEGMQLHPVDDAHWHQFPAPGGVTGFVMLAESHLACHTFPEYGSICLNLFCCKPRAAMDFEEALRDMLGARRVAVRQLDRPYEA
ncbi:MAG: S-adenosylmethionine decarboxylase [Bryobacter sp.]|nr:S-adenosylmethionine decarboxylase [Bryobacter sp.]